MPTLSQLLDKHPKDSVFYGPSYFGAIETGHMHLWRAWYNNSGVFFAKDASKSGIRAPKSEDILQIDSLSACFDSGSNFWAAVHKGDSASIFHFSNSGYVDYEFSGMWPQLFNNFELYLGKSETQCFYTKSDRKNVFLRRSSDNFSTETLFYSGSREIKRLTSVWRQVSAITYYRMVILGLDDFGDGIVYESNIYDPKESFFAQNFDIFEDGNTFFPTGWNAEPLFASILDGHLTRFDSFDTYVDGEISYFYGDVNQLSSGYLLTDVALFYPESFDRYVTGKYEATGQDFFLIYG